ncbi:hypothetical protein BH10PSE3_BH10PSE3_10760 [soil metagenome]
MAASGNWSDLRLFVSNMIKEATDAGAKKMLISAERLFLLAESPGIFSRFTDELRKQSGGDFRIVMVVRDIKSYIRSYLIQLINNGSLLLDDAKLAAWTINLVKVFWNIEDPVTAISFDQAVSRNALVDRFCIALGCEGLRLPETWANGTPNRGHDFSASVGVACRLMSLSRDVDINSEAMDLERLKAERKFDLLHAANSSRGANGESSELFLGDMIEQALNEYVVKCLEVIPESDREFYGEIVNSALSWNYPRFMGGSGLKTA